MLTSRHTRKTICSTPVAGGRKFPQARAAVAGMAGILRHLVILIGVIGLMGCGGKSDSPSQKDTATAGAATFSVAWPQAMRDASSFQANAITGDVCVDYNISSMTCNVFNASGAIVQSRNWPCDDHLGTVEKLPVGSGLWLELVAIVDASPRWSGRSAEFAIYPDTTTNVGKVDMRDTGVDNTPPAILSTTPLNGTSPVALDAVVTATFTEDVAADSVQACLSLSREAQVVGGAVTYDPGSRTATFTPDADLAEDAVYTATASSDVRDLAGNTMAGTVTWQFTTVKLDAPLVTAEAAAPVTYDSAVMNGTIQPNGLSTEWYFEYWYGGNPPTRTTLRTIAAGVESVAVSSDTTPVHLTANTEYRYRLVAANAMGTTTSNERWFRTEVVWAHTLDGGGTERAYMVQATPDNGYIACGANYVPDTFVQDFWVVKLDAAGSVVWERTYAGAKPDTAKCIRNTAEGGYIFVGDTQSYGPGTHGTQTPMPYDLAVLKITGDGTVSWSTVMGGQSDDLAASVLQTPDGGHVVLGTTESFGQGGSDIWVVKLTSGGMITWQKTYGGPQDEVALSILPVSGGGYMVSGYTDSYGMGRADIWILKLASDGTVLWEKTYGGVSSEWSGVIEPSDDGGYFIACTTESFGTASSAAGDIWVFKLDADGNVVWQRTYGLGFHEIVQGANLTTDGGLIITAAIMDINKPLFDNIWLLKIDANGAIQWQKTYGGDKGDNPYDIRSTDDGGYIVAGETRSFGSDGTGQNPSSNAWFMKTNATGDLGCGLGVSSSAVIFTPDAAGQASGSTVADTTSDRSPFIQPGLPSTHTVEVICPIVWK